MHEMTVAECEALAEDLSRTYISSLDASKWSPEQYVDNFFEYRKRIRNETLALCGLENHTYND